MPAPCMARWVAIATYPPCEYPVTNTFPLPVTPGAVATGNAFVPAVKASIMSLDC